MNKMLVFSVIVLAYAALASTLPEENQKKELSIEEPIGVLDYTTSTDVTITKGTIDEISSIEITNTGQETSYYSILMDVGCPVALSVVALIFYIIIHGVFANDRQEFIPYP